MILWILDIEFLVDASKNPKDPCNSTSHAFDGSQFRIPENVVGESPQGDRVKRLFDGTRLPNMPRPLRRVGDHVK